MAKKDKRRTLVYLIPEGETRESTLPQSSVAVKNKNTCTRK